MGGGLLTLWPAVGTADGQGILVPAANDLRLYHYLTGKVVRRLSGHSNLVTCAARHPTDASQVFTGGLDGTLRLWDLDSGRQLAEYEAGLPIFSLAICAEGRYAFLMLQDFDGSGKVRMMDLESRDICAPVPDTFSTPAPLAVLSPVVLLCSGMQAMPDPVNGLVQPVAMVDKFATFEQQQVFVWPTDAWEPQALEVSVPKVVSCVALDLTGSLMATGDVTGRINLYRGVGQAVQAVQGARGKEGKGKQRRARLPRSTLHWHAHRVGALCFSPDGEWLLSGGLEAVLVKWRLRGTGQTYFPRLGGAITCIDASPADPASYVVTQADNTIRLINVATNKAVGTIYGIRPVPRLPVGYRSRAVLLPGSGDLVVPGPNAQLQFYDALGDTHVNKLSAYPRNTVSLTQTELDEAAGGRRAPLQPVVAHMAVGAGGACLATVDLRPDLAHEAVGRGWETGAATLKFWERAPLETAGSQSPYIPVTEVLDPHRGRVTDLVFHPVDALAVTTSDGGEFRVWTQAVGPHEDIDDGELTEADDLVGVTSWRCHSVGSYCDLPCNCAAFSTDGSLLAVGTGDQVTLWDPWENALLGTLEPPFDSTGCPVTRLAFIPGTPFLAASSEGRGGCLTVWNLLEMRIWWSHVLGVSDLAADPEGSFFAVSIPAGEPGTLPVPPEEGSGADDVDNAVPPPRRLGANGAVPANSTVLLFEASSPVPVGAWALPRGRASSVLFAPQGTRLAASSVPGRPSALLVLTEEREFTVLNTVPTRLGESPSGEASQDAGALPQGATAYNALFGPATAVQAGGKEDDSDDEEDERGGAGRAGKPRVLEGLNVGSGGAGPPVWRDLMDAPAHALPPLSVLCPAFLDLLLTASPPPPS
eukprot:jgi/Botrbrau1/18632/Bobra.0367s0068.1